jgi:iron(III) transport system ATP-binding protein
MSLLRIEKVSKTFMEGKVKALQEVDLVIEENQIVGLLGPSGCGKTTLLRSISGFERPDNGKIFFRDKALLDGNLFVPPEKRKIGMVFQDFAVFPHLKVCDNITFGLSRFEKKEKFARLDRMLKLFRIEALSEKWPHELSGGQLQRVAMARTMAVGPELILFDEPFSNLDMVLKYEMRDEICDILRSENLSALFVTHDQDDALVTSDKVVVLSEGMVQQEGAPKEVYNFPKNEFVANFVGKTNIINAKVLDSSLGIVESHSFGKLRPNKFTSSLIKGNEIKLSIRPEQIEISKEGPFVGEVMRSRYLGHLCEISVRYQSQVLTLFSHHHKELTEGEEISFRFKEYAPTILD